MITKVWALLLVLPSLLGNHPSSEVAFNDEIELWKYNDLASFIKKEDGKVLIVNFWATWCGPCIKEMPYFEQLAENYSSKVSIIFVSLDFADQLEKKVKPFVQKKQIKSKVVILDDGNYNEWIGKVSEDWSGAIPATLFVSANREQEVLYEREFDYKSLSEKLELLLEN